MSRYCDHDPVRAEIEPQTSEEKGNPDSTFFLIVGCLCQMLDLDILCQIEMLVLWVGPLV